MDKEKYLAELGRRLKSLSEDEKQDALEYYEGYLDDAGKNVEKAIKELGTPAEVSAKILAEAVIKKEDSSSEKPKKTKLKTTWAVILAIFAAPIGLPLAISVFVVVLSLLIALITVIVSFMATGVGMIIAGIVYIPLSVAVMIQSTGTGLAILGSGLAMLGLGMLFAKGAYLLAQVGFGGVAKLASKTILRKETK